MSDPTPAGITVVSEQPPAQLLDALRRPRGAALMLGHVHPDGDVLGTLLGLGLAMEAAGWSVSYGGPDPVPAVLDFIPGRRPLAGVADRAAALRHHRAHRLPERRAHRGAPGRGARAGEPGAQHRPPPGQSPLRHRQLDRPDRGRDRRDDPRSARRSRVADPTRDRPRPLHRGPHRHRLVPLLQHHPAHVPDRGRPHRGGGRARARHRPALPAPAEGRARDPREPARPRGDERRRTGGHAHGARGRRLRGVHGRRGPRDLPALDRGREGRGPPAGRAGRAGEGEPPGQGRRAGQSHRASLRRRRPRERGRLHPAGPARRGEDRAAGRGPPGPRRRAP